MNQLIASAVQEEFSHVRRSPGVSALQKAVLERMERRYRTLKKQGYREREACQLALREMGDLTKMVRAARAAENREKARCSRRKVILFIVGIFFLLLSILPMVTLGKSEAWHSWGIVLMLCSLIIGVFFWIGSLGCKPHTIDAARIARGDFGTASEQDEEEDGSRPIYSLARNALWIMTGVLYLILSLSTKRWEMTWLVLLIGFCMTRLAKAVADFFGGKRRKSE